MGDNTDLDLSFAIDAETVSLSPIGEYQVLDLEGPVVIVGDASYRVVPVGEESDLSEDVRELSVDEIRAALSELADNDDFQSIVDNCPTNTPLVYDDIDYLTRHLPTASLQKCGELSESTPFEKELLLQVAYVERQNSLVGHSDNVLEYYLEQRAEIAEKLRSTDEIDSDVERSFFSYLLLASALIEELTTETVLNELFREEGRLDSITEHVRSMGHAKRLEKLCDIQILTEGDHGSLVEVKKRRNNLVHDAQKRAGLDELESRREVAQILEKTDRCASVLLTISGKNIESVIAKRGCDPYIEHAQSEAVADTITTWEQEYPERLSRLHDCEQAALEKIRWDTEESDPGNNITEGFTFEGFDNEVLYEILMEFVGDASKAFLDRIDADANESNLDRFDFAVMVLLCAGHSYGDIARWLDTDEKYVQRKENVIAWRASKFEKGLVEEIPRPEDPTWPSDTESDD
ncbi:hypothetical protein HLRTI_002302 [Halorhabdus tiamatea SARL4B]|uniref:Uncharacterized protein n=1 Tax=Halorhabdus tiamatea SARL4B TaxID=1033806 RepID=F7PQT5_9EURY|nr:hypothetical protein [Halorhabdus tiamatea]ERJ05680.1 hypothetical protein HLRTI_002302 [Halorhabdus tiamatea SARL4B]CCQ34898.1 hypothetical protein HTIA_p2796 [Halorhabdus tiamatea SARL4B]